MATSKTLELSIKIAGRMDKSLTAAINGTQSKIGSLTKSISNIGTVGLATMGAVATAAAVGIAGCTKEAQALESAMAPVVRYVDGLADASGAVSDAIADNGKTFKQNYGALKTYIQDLSTEIPRTTDQLTAMSAALGQSGIGVDQQLTTGYLRDTAVTATAMDLDDQTAGNYVAKWEASFNFDHKQVMTLLDQINYLGAHNATTAGEIAQSVNSAASMGQIAGVDPAATAAMAIVVNNLLEIVFAVLGASFTALVIPWLKDTTYMTGKEAVEKGFADELLDDAEPLEISASADSQTISCKGHALRLMPGVKLPDNIPLAKAPAPVATAAANTKTAVEPANTNEGGQTPMAKETNGAQTPTPAVENPQAAVDAAVSAERHRLEEIDQIAGLFNAEMVHEAKYGATACDARELAFRAAKQATQQGRDFLTALGIDNQQSGTQSVSAVPGESAEGSPEGTPAELTPAEKMAAARQSVKALLHPETNKEGKNNG